MLYEVITSGSIDTENPFYSEIIKGADIFCADGGANHLFKLGGIPKLIRITSYNVCYTKLLRPAIYSDRGT